MKLEKIQMNFQVVIYIAGNKKRDYKITNKSGGSTIFSSTFTTFSGSGKGGDGERSSCTSGVFLYSMANTSFLSTCFFQNKMIDGRHFKFF